MACAAGDTGHWWQPGVFWPTQPPPEDYGIGVLVQVFQALGYEDGGLNAAFKAGAAKVALYDSSLYYTHAARQLPNGKWTSKLGSAEDIEHDTPNDVASGVYGEVVQSMKRKAAGAA